MLLCDCAWCGSDLRLLVFLLIFFFSFKTIASFNHFIKFLDSFSGWFLGAVFKTISNEQNRSFGFINWPVEFSISIRHRDEHCWFCPFYCLRLMQYRDTLPLNQSVIDLKWMSSDRLTWLKRHTWNKNQKKVESWKFWPFHQHRNKQWIDVYNVEKRCKTVWILCLI